MFSLACRHFRSLGAHLFSAIFLACAFFFAASASLAQTFDASHLRQATNLDATWLVQGGDNPSPPLTTVDNSTRQAEANPSPKQSPDTHVAIDYANWALVFVALLTLVAIWKQARESAKATKAMLKSVEVQEAEFLQWIDIGEWTVQPDEYVDWARQGDQIIRKPEQIKVRIAFHLLNNSTRPLSICSVHTAFEIGPEKPPTVTSYVVEEEMEVPPKGEYGVVIDTVFTGIQVFGYVMDMLAMVATVQVDFTNALKKPGQAQFERLVRCGIACETSCISRGHVSKEIKSESAK